MTDETKKLFNAPWHTAKSCMDYAVSTEHGDMVASDSDDVMSVRISHIPDLFAYLLDKVYYDCSTCYCKNKGFLLQQTMDKIIDAGCPLKRKFCDNNAVFKLLMEVRDGKIVNKELKK